MHFMRNRYHFSVLTRIASVLVFLFVVAGRAATLAVAVALRTRGRAKVLLENGVLHAFVLYGIEEILVLFALAVAVYTEYDHFVFRYALYFLRGLEQCVKLALVFHYRNFLKVHGVVVFVEKSYYLVVVDDLHFFVCHDYFLLAFSALI